MKNILTTLILILLSINVMAQSPDKISYQAVVRNSSNALIVNQQVGVKVTLLQGTANGTAVYTETHTPATNANGLISIEIGGGVITADSFNKVNWANGPYFIKTEIDPNGGVNYSISGTTQLLSVPYALHAKSVEKYDEVDPVFSKSVAKGILNSDTSKWNGKLDSYTESDPMYNASIAKGITAIDTSKWNKKEFSHYIGERFGGGVIFHLWLDSNRVEHGLIVSLNNQSDSSIWSNIDTSFVGYSAQSIWNGFLNSNSIITQIGHTNSAAKVCLDYNTSGNNDWYLPSIQELSILWNNYYVVAQTIANINGAEQISQGYYWSSSEYYFPPYSPGFAQGFSFNWGASISLPKLNQCYVRAVSVF